MVLITDVAQILLLWLWCRLVATAPIRPPAWEPPYVSGVALKRQKTKKKKKRKIKLTNEVLNTFLLRLGISKDTHFHHLYSNVWEVLTTAMGWGAVRKAEIYLVFIPVSDTELLKPLKFP